MNERMNKAKQKKKQNISVKLPHRLPSIVCWIIFPVGQVMLYASIPFTIGCFVRTAFTELNAIFLRTLGTSNFNGQSHNLHAQFQKKELSYSLFLKKVSTHHITLLLPKNKITRQLNYLKLSIFILSLNFISLKKITSIRISLAD